MDRHDGHLFDFPSKGGAESCFERFFAEYGATRQRSASESWSFSDPTPTLLGGDQRAFANPTNQGACKAALVYNKRWR